ncbi:MAG: fold metallo-hydrolase [Adhaeribacter sp.]|nr:fold metallo-hydrolase [Adhaeribacter sp.]
MKIEQFEDKGLAHYAYAVISESTKEIILIDPARDPQPYLNYAHAHQARITGVIETHPHADFVSSHLELHQLTGATIYVSKQVGADYPHQAFDEGSSITLGNITLRAINTPGHSPDSISVVLNYNGQDLAVFTGDTLFIGDVGRPDLREKASDVTAKREELARQMYYSTREKLMKLDDAVVVYPAHGAGTLCGKALRLANSSTIGEERKSNYALQDMSEEEFVQLITADQPFIPKYFSFNVRLNKQGAPAYNKSISAIPLLNSKKDLAKEIIIIDIRDQESFKAGHLPCAINLQNGVKFETWLGSIVGSEEQFYLVAATATELEVVIAKTAKIGYEQNIKGVLILPKTTEVQAPAIDVADFRENQENYTIVDVRNAAEVKEKPVFAASLNIPLPELRERTAEIPLDKPIVVHCAGGYRSAAGSSILQGALTRVPVLDLSEAINQFNK